RALRVTAMACRPGNRLNAGNAPSGAPNKVASNVALRLTASDRRTIANSVAAPLSTSCSADACSGITVTVRGLAVARPALQPRRARWPAVAHRDRLAPARAADPPRPAAHPTGPARHHATGRADAPRSAPAPAHH